jgi:hypothetical protein
LSFVAMIFSPISTRWKVATNFTVVKQNFSIYFVVDYKTVKVLKFRPTYV